MQNQETEIENHSPPALPSGKPYTGLPTTSLRDVSQSALTTAIHSPHDHGATLKRVNAVLALYFVPDEDFETKAAVREEFLRALASYPNWAVQQAFDAWTRNRVRRPSPGEIVVEVGNAMRPVTDEIARRKKMVPPEPVVDRVSKEAAQAIMERAGFAPKPMAKRPTRETATPEEWAAYIAPPSADEVAEYQAQVQK